MSAVNGEKRGDRVEREASGGYLFRCDTCGVLFPRVYVGKSGAYCRVHSPDFPTDLFSVSRQTKSEARRIRKESQQLRARRGE